MIEYDDSVDNAFNDIEARLIGELAGGKTDGERLVDLLMIAKYYEKIGDHAEMMARWVIFSVSGKVTVKNS